MLWSKNSFIRLCSLYTTSCPSSLSQAHACVPVWFSSFPPADMLKCFGRWLTVALSILPFHYWALFNSAIGNHLQVSFTFSYYDFVCYIYLLFVVACVCSLYRMQLYVLYVPRWLSSNAWASNPPWHKLTYLVLTCRKTPINQSISLLYIAFYTKYHIIGAYKCEVNNAAKLC